MTKSPRLMIYCEGKHYLTVELTLAMENKEETIKVKDAVSCDILVKKGAHLSEVQYTVYHTGTERNGRYAIVDASNADKLGTSTFSVLPRCFLENLKDDADFKYIYSNKASPQRQAIDLMQNEIKSGQLICEKVSLLERFALLTVLYSVNKFASDPHGPQCSWPTITCGVLGKVEEIVIFPNNYSGTLATEIALLKELRKIDLSKQQNIRNSLCASLCDMYLHQLTPFCCLFYV